MSYKPPMGDPTFLQKRSKSSGSRSVSGVEAVVYTGTSSAMMDMVKTNEPSVKQQPGEMFRRVRPTTVANFVERQVMEQRRQMYGEGCEVDDEAMAQYRAQIEPLDEHRNLYPVGSNAQGGNVYGSPTSRNTNSSASSRTGQSGTQQQHSPVRAGGLVYIDRNMSGAARPPSRTSTAGDTNYYASMNRTTTGSRTVPQNVVAPLNREEQQDPDIVARYNSTITNSIRPDISESTRGGLAPTPAPARVATKLPPRAPSLSKVQQLNLRKEAEEMPSDEAPISERQMLILDVREKEDYDQCHIIGAFHFPQIRLAHATNPFSLPEVYQFKNKKNHMIVLYDLEEEITVARKMGNIFFEKGADNVYIMAGGLRAFVQTHNHLIVGECPVPIVAKSSRLGAYGADKSTLGSYANRSSVGGAGASRMGTGVASSGRRALSSSRVGGSVLGGARVPGGLSSSLARK